MALVFENDIVDIIAPASAASFDVAKAQGFIRALGLVPRIASDIINPDSRYVSNSLEYRLSSLKNALYAPDSKLVWCLRGGYGSMNLIPELSKLEQPHESKFFIGFSDITALHLFLNQHWNWPTIHGRMIGDLSENYDDELISSWKNLLFKQEDLSYELIPINEPAKSKQSIKSQITGGNLCLVENSLATSWQIKPAGKILFLEETGEKPYRIDRSFDHLRQAGIFNDVEAVIFGAFNDPDQELMNYAINNFANSLDIPVLSMPYAGHTPNNPPIPFGSEAILNLGEVAQLVCKIV